MPATEPPHHSAGPDAADSGPTRLYFCLCGRCPIVDNSDDEFELDSCLHAAQDLLGMAGKGVPPDDEFANVALQSARGLLIHARLSLCMQRQAARNEGSSAL
jgi:hypothetical protein